MPSAAVMPSEMAICTPVNTSASSTTTMTIMSKWPSMACCPLDLRRRGDEFIRRTAGDQGADGVQPMETVGNDHQHGANQHNGARGKSGYPQSAFALIFAADPGI